MPAAIKKDCAGSPIRADLQDFVDAARQLGDEALRLEHVVEQQIEVDVAGADHDERFFLSLLAHLSLPYQVDGDIASAAGAGSGREPPSRSDERRVGKECVSTGRSRGSPTH